MQDISTKWETACPGTLRCSTYRNLVTQVDLSSVRTSENCLHENDKLFKKLQQFENDFSPDRNFHLIFLDFQMRRLIFLHLTNSNDAWKSKEKFDLGENTFQIAVTF